MTNAINDQHRPSWRERLTPRARSTWLTFVSIALFVAAMPLPSFCVDGSCDAWTSSSVLIFGWVEMLVYPSAGVIWLANPLLLGAWLAVLVKFRWVGLVFAAAALVTALAFMGISEVVTSESGATGSVTGLAAGYVLWTASCALACIAALSVRPKP